MIENKTSMFSFMESEKKGEKENKICLGVVRKCVEIKSKSLI